MKILGSTLIALMLMSHAYLGICPLSMGSMPESQISLGQGAPLDASQADSHSPGFCDCTAAPLTYLTPAALTTLEPSGAWQSIVVPFPRTPSLRLIDPPPRL